MQITRIFHSGFLVETAKRYFIFDYYKGELPKLNPDKPVYVFASHGHQDHYEPKVFELLKQQGIVPKLAILAKDIKEKKYADVITFNRCRRSVSRYLRGRKDLSCGRPS